MLVFKKLCDFVYFTSQYFIFCYKYTLQSSEKHSIKIMLHLEKLFDMLISCIFPLQEWQKITYTKWELAIYADRAYFCAWARQFPDRTLCT